MNYSSVGEKITFAQYDTVFFRQDSMGDITDLHISKDKNHGHTIISYLAYGTRYYICTDLPVTVVTHESIPDSNNTNVQF